MMPAVHGRVLRLFGHQGTWYVASNQRLEALPCNVRLFLWIFCACIGFWLQCPVKPAGNADTPTTSYLGLLFEGCLLRHYARSVYDFTQIQDGMCTRAHISSCLPNWIPPVVGFLPFFRDAKACFFLEHAGCFPTLFFKTVCTMSIWNFPSIHTFRGRYPYFRLICHQMQGKKCCANIFTARTRSSTPDMSWVRTDPSHGGDLYDGILVINTRTMFALRVSYPSMVFLAPLLKHQMCKEEFLATRVVQASYVDLNHPSHDHIRRERLAVQPGLLSSVRKHFSESISPMAPR